MATKPAVQLTLRFPAGSGSGAFHQLQKVYGLVSRALMWIHERQSGRSGGRRLRVTETVHLGEKRFVAVIQMDGNQFLVGGGATGVALLAQLKKVESVQGLGKGSFEDLLTETLSAPEGFRAGSPIEPMRVPV